MLATSFQTLLDLTGDAFGGYSVLEKLLSQAELEYLVQFPGFIHIIKPWAIDIDLSDYQYITNKPYFVLDKNFNYLYNRVAPDAWFGRTDRDIQLAINTLHGQYVHLHLPTEQGHKLGLLWVCNELNPAQIQQTVQTWVRAYEARQTKQVINEVFLDTTEMPPGNLINIFFAPGLWVQQYSATEISSHSQVERIKATSGETISIYPKQTGWYLIEYFNPQTEELIPLSIDNPTGVGYQRIRAGVKTATYHIELQNASLSGTRASALVGSAGNKFTWLTQSQKMRVEGQLFFKEFGLSFGRSIAEARYVTIHTVVPEETFGESEVRSFRMQAKTVIIEELEESDLIEAEIFGSGFYSIADPIEADLFYGAGTRADDGSFAGSSSIGRSTAIVNNVLA